MRRRRHAAKLRRGVRIVCSFRRRRPWRAILQTCGRRAASGSLDRPSMRQPATCAYRCAVRRGGGRCGARCIVAWVAQGGVGLVELIDVGACEALCCLQVGAGSAAKRRVVTAKTVRHRFCGLQCHTQERWIDMVKACTPHASSERRALAGESHLAQPAEVQLCCCIVLVAPRHLNSTASALQSATTDAYCPCIGTLVGLGIPSMNCHHAILLHLVVMMLVRLLLHARWCAAALWQSCDAWTSRKRNTTHVT